MICDAESEYITLIPQAIWRGELREGHAFRVGYYTFCVSFVSGYTQDNQMLVVQRKYMPELIVSYIYIYV